MEIDLYYQQLIDFKLTKNHRDLLINTHHLVNNICYKIYFIGVIKLIYNTIVKGNGFNLSDKYNSDNLDSIADAFHWGIKSFEISDWKIESDTDELAELETDYNYKIYKMILITTTFKIEIFFCDLKVENFNNLK